MKIYILFFGLGFCLLQTQVVFSGETISLEKKTQKITSTQDKALFEKRLKAAENLTLQNKLLDAQKEAQALIASVSSEEERLRLFRLLRKIRFQLIFSKKKTDTSEIYVVQQKDSMGKIAKKYKTTIELIRKANRRKNNVVWEGMKLKVEKELFSIEVHTRPNILWLKQGVHYVKKYSVSTGEKGNTPLGNFKIANKVVNPTWYYENEVFAPGDPKNGLGTRWLGFDLKGYGIHGTIEPEKIGQPASLGCVRLRNEDAEELFDLIPIGTSVVIKK